MKMIRFVIVMGVSGCGWTRIGKSLAEYFVWDFYESDNFHPPANESRQNQAFELQIGEAKSPALPLKVK